MMTEFRQLSLLLFLLVFAAGCSTPSSPEESNAAMSCNINGRLWETAIGLGHYTSGVRYDSVQYEIWGNNSGGYIGLATDSLVLGTRALSEAVYQKRYGEERTYICTDCGTLEILEMDTLHGRLIGRFEFVGVSDQGDTVRVERGRFNVFFLF